MKKLLLLFTLVFFCTTIYSQDTKLPKIETKGDLQEVTIFYKSGAIMQHGYFTKDGKLHSSWESYNEDGTPKCFTTYNYGLKVGVWTYWNKDKITKVVYNDNKIVKIEESEIPDKLKSNY